MYLTWRNPSSPTFMGLWFQLGNNTQVKYLKSESLNSKSSNIRVLYPSSSGHCTRSLACRVSVLTSTESIDVVVIYAAILSKITQQSLHSVNTWVFQTSFATAFWMRISKTILILKNVYFRAHIIAKIIVAKTDPPVIALSSFLLRL